jgi:hypothetical protein
MVQQASGAVNTRLGFECTDTETRAKVHERWRATVRRPTASRPES